MGRTYSNGGIALTVLIFVLSAGIAPHLLSDEGRSTMKNSTFAGGALAGKPLMDEVVPGSLKTATFAMG
jgi:hypothetical protein